MENNTQKEQDELKALLNTPNGSDEEEQGKDSSGKQDEITSVGANQNDVGNDNGQDDSVGDDNKNEGKNSEGKNDRWNGKSREDVIKEVESLETRIANFEGKKKDDKDAKPKGTKEKESEKLPSAEELQKMTPGDFAKWVLAKIDEGVKTTLDTQEKVRDAVRKEIDEAKKDHPLDDPDYRKMVLTIIDAASAKGTTVSLKEACEQVDAFIGKHKAKSEDISDDERSRLKKAKAQVESGAGAPAQPDNSDAETDRIQKALGRSGSRGSLGGLGV
jgi:hypothetical protein